MLRRRGLHLKRVMRMSDILDDVIACETDMVIRASAGTGKTYTLVHKFLSDLTTLQDGKYITVDRLAAITFTEKAAGEMVERVRAGLSAKINDLTNTISSRPSSDDLLIDKELVEKKKKLTHLINQRQLIAGSYISTIHSFCARLLKERPLSAQIDPSFKIADEKTASELLENSAHAVILRRLRGGDEKTFRLLLSLGLEAQGNFGSGLKTEIKRLIPLIRSARLTTDDIWRKYESHRLILEEEAGSLRAELFAMVPKLHQQKRNTSAYRIVEKIQKLDYLGENTPLTIEQAAHLYTLADWVDKKGNKENEILGRKTAEILRGIAGPTFESEIAKDQKTLLSLIKDTLDDYTAEKHKRSYLDFDDLEEKTHHLLANDSAVRNSYKAQFHRISVDEFQDTNNLQRMIITTLAPPGENRLLIVGDPKQSIYGFRGADFTVFEETAQKIIENGGAGFTLNISRRSTPDLIRFFNSFFPELMKNESGKELCYLPEHDSLIPHRSCEQVPHKPERLFTPDGKGNDKLLDEAYAVADLIIKDILARDVWDEKINSTRPAKPGDVAILFRTLSHLAAFESAFTVRNLPYTVVNGAGFHKSGEVRDIVNVLQYLDYSGDILSLFSVLRSPFAALSDSTLLSLRRTDGGKTRDLCNLLDDNEDFSIDGAEGERLRDFINNARRWKKNRDRMTISELLETIVSDSGYLAVTVSRVNGERKLANVFKLIELARKYETDGRRGLVNFISFLKMAEERSLKESHAGLVEDDELSVKIMTAHQGKGLEFPVVILGNVNFGGKNESSRVAFHSHGGMGMQYYHTDSGIWTKAQVFAKVNSDIKAWNRGELKRLLYVAATRARDRLIVSAPLKSRDDESWRNWIDTIVESKKLEVSIPDMEKIGKLPGELYIRDAQERVDASVFAPITEESHQIRVTLSITDLAGFRYCQRLRYYRSLPDQGSDRPGKGKVSASEIGSSVHDIMRELPGDLDRLIEKFFPEPGVSEQAMVRTNIKRAFNTYPLNLLAKADLVVREEPMVIRIAEDGFLLTLTGTPDIAWKTGDELYVADYKYSERPEAETAYLYQVSLYAGGWMINRNAVKVTAALIYLKGKETVVSETNINNKSWPQLRASVVKDALKLRSLHGKPEQAWEKRNIGKCKDITCHYRLRCFGKESFST